VFFWTEVERALKEKGGGEDWGASLLLSVFSVQQTFEKRRRKNDRILKSLGWGGGADAFAIWAGGERIKKGRKGEGKNEYVLIYFR